MTVGVTAAAVGAHLAGTHLVPGLRHVQHHALFVQRLEREGDVGRNLGEEAGVGVAIGIKRLASGR
mgnify:CR=1 FL=1